jgi:hypothetical protein
MRKPLALALILTFIAVSAFITKPSDDKCRRAAKQKFEEKLQATSAGLPQNINKEVWLQTMEKSFEESVVVEDKFVYKTIWQQSNSNKKNIGWGAFNFVQIDL